MDASYTKEHVTADAFPDFIKSLRNKGYVGANVTIPHKEAAFAVVDRHDPTAQTAGAVNTVWFDGDDLVGANSDIVGFLRNLDQYAPGWDQTPGGDCALIMGAGGAARAVLCGLAERGFQNIVIANRSIDRAEKLLGDLLIQARVVPLGFAEDHLPQARVIVNTTSLGMDGQPSLPLPLDRAPKTALVTDIVYTPLQTPLLMDAAHHGLQTVDGLGMLLHQAALGFEMWFGVRPEVTQALRDEVLAALAAE